MMIKKLSPVLRFCHMGKCSGAGLRSDVVRLSGALFADNHRRANDGTERSLFKSLRYV